MKKENEKCNAFTIVKRHSDWIQYGEECGKPVAYKIKYDQKAWPMNWGEVVFCDDCGDKLWQELKELLGL
jgi:hypothetical protein